MSHDRKTKGDGTVATNRKARHNYEILETWEAGLSLVGSEVKSLRAGTVSFGDGYVVDVRGELWLMNVHIHEYPQANRENHDPKRSRKLLLHRHEIEAIRKEMHEKQRAVIPLKLYFKRGRCKALIGLGIGKKSVDKRHDIKARDIKREIARERSQY